jgi:hypothetical protein
VENNIVLQHWVQSREYTWISTRDQQIRKNPVGYPPKLEPQPSGLPGQCLTIQKYRNIDTLKYRYFRSDTEYSIDTFFSIRVPTNMSHSAARCSLFMQHISWNIYWINIAYIIHKSSLLSTRNANTMLCGYCMEISSPVKSLLRD